MGIVVDVLLHLEGQIGRLHLHADIDVEALSSLCSLFVVLAIHGKLRVVGVFHPATFILLIYSGIYTSVHKAFVELIEQVELTGQIHHGTRLASLVDHKERGNACGTGHIGVIRTKRRSDMHDTGTIFSRHIITRDYAEGLIGGVVPIALSIQLHRLYPRQQLSILHTDQLRTFVFAHDLEGNQFITRLVILQAQALGLGVEMVIEQGLGQHSSHLLTRIGIVGLNSHVINLRTYTEGRIRRQGPRRSGPG